MYCWLLSWPWPGLAPPPPGQAAAAKPWQRPVGARRPRSYQSVAIYRVPPPCPGEARRPTKVLLFIVFPPCPAEARRPRSYQSLVIYRVPPTARVGLGGLEVTKVLLFIVFLPCPAEARRPRSYQSIAIYRVPPLPGWGSAASKLPRCRYLSCAPPCPGEASWCCKGFWILMDMHRFHGSLWISWRYPWISMVDGQLDPCWVHEQISADTHGQISQRTSSRQTRLADDGMMQGMFS